MSSRRNTGSLVGGSLLIIFGVLALLGKLFQNFNFWNTFWPFFIIGVGLLFFVGMFAGGKSVSGLAIPGSIITTIGLMLFYQNLTNHWESWSYGWTVILMAVGLGIFIMGAWGQNESQRAAGLRVLRIGLIMFIIFGAFFELIFTAGMPFGLRSIVFPAALILLGLYLILTRSGLLPGRSENTASDFKATDNSLEE
jgi:LiaF transmembrane domain